MENIKVGDRVKATNKNGDTAEFTVQGINRDDSGSYASTTNWYFIHEGWTFEKIEPPLPTEPGIYQPNNTNIPIQNMRTFALSSSGYWREFRVSDQRLSAQEVLETVTSYHKTLGLVRLVRENL